METVDVVIATYGDKDVWDALAERAIASVEHQSHHPDTIIRSHNTTLASARNCGAQAATSDWLIFLDADDELDEGYVEAMLRNDDDICQPSTLGVVDGQEDDYPVLIPPQTSFMAGNHLVIGSMVRRTQFMAIGGFRELPVLEDWDLFIRLRLNGANVGASPGAIYRVHVRSDSRNQDAGLHGQVYMEIQQRYQNEWYQKGLA